MHKIAILLVAIILIVLVLKIGNNTKPNQTDTTKQTTAIESINPIQSQKPELLPTISKSMLDSGQKLTFTEYWLSFILPDGWSFNASPMNKQEYKGKFYFSGSIALQPADKEFTVTIIPNHQGGWCEGDTTQEQVSIASRFGLKGTKYVCGYGTNRGEYILYSSQNGFPNLFISLYKTNDIEPEVRSVIQSLEYQLP